MGLKNGERFKVQYVKITKDGKFQTGKDENAATFYELEGKLTDLYLRDEEYQGQPIRKLNIVVEDGGEKYILGILFDSFYTYSLLSLLMNADLTKNMTFSAKVEEKKDAEGKPVVRRTLFISQDNTPLKWYFTKAHPNGLPQIKQIKVSGKKVWDKTELLEFYEDLINNKLKPALKKPSPTVDIAPEKQTQLPWDKEDVEETADVVDDLPF